MMMIDHLVTINGVPVRAEITGLETATDADPWVTVRITCRRCDRVLSYRRYDARLGVPRGVKADARRDGLTANAHQCGETN